MQMKKNIILPAVAGFLVIAHPCKAKTLIDYFLPTPAVAALKSDKWGCAAVGKRDICNGLEDSTSQKYSYWDGKIIKAVDGKYHLFASRWDQSLGHWSGWPQSVAIHAISDNVLGPYLDMGVAYTDNNSRGHNVTAFRYNDGSYGLLISQTRPASVYNASSLNGPWTLKGVIAHNYDHTKTLEPGANTLVLPLADGNFLEVGRHGYLFKSVNKNILNMEIQTYTSAYPNNVPGLEATQPYAEDPVLWFSGGRYHMVVNWPGSRVARHLMSDDGINNWKDMGIAYDPRIAFIRYTDGTVNKWNKLERPGIVMDENGHVSHFTFAALDVDKGNDKGNDLHNSKIVVVPFDGVSFDKDFGIPTSEPIQNRTIPGKNQFMVKQNGAFTVTCPGYESGEVEFRLLRLNGEMVLRQRSPVIGGKGEFRFDRVAYLSRGTYLIRVVAGNNVLEKNVFVRP
jgi:hypothetical protein